MIAQLTKTESLQICVHGISASVECSDPQIREWFAFDFRCFVTDMPTASADIHLYLHLRPPPESAVPPLDEVMHTPHFVCFERGPVRYVDYQGKALAIYDYDREEGRIFCEDPQEAYERLYLTVLSRIGEKLDYRGLHRVHSLGISFDGAGCLFLIPQGGGKTTLALSLLQDSRVKLLSEDTPFINFKRQIVPFPFRLGVTNGENTDPIPCQFKRVTGRKAGGYKVLVDLEFFRGKIAQHPVSSKFLFCGRWTTASTPRMASISKLAALRYLIRDCVFGLGLPQVIEFFLQSGLKSCLMKAVIACSRLAASAAIVTTSQCYQLYLCKDRAKNVEMITEFLES